MLLTEPPAAALNVPQPKVVSHDELVGVVARLFDAGELAITSFDPTTEREQLVTKAEFHTALNSRRFDKLAFGLTQRGGAEWEKIAMPDWGRFIGELSDSKEVFLASSSYERIVGYMGWYGGLSAVSIRWPTVTWENYALYAITYWKRLPSVHVVRFETERHDKPWIIEPGWLSSWWTQYSRWHSDPLETTK